MFVVAAHLRLYIEILKVILKVFKKPSKEKEEVKKTHLEL